jgi:integrase
MSKHMPSLGLKYTTWDSANGIYLYQREVPKDAIWLLQRKKITISLGSKPAEARARYMEVHPKWERAIRDAIERLHADPDTDSFMDRVVLFLNSQAAQFGGELPESGLVQDEFNWAARGNLWHKWAKWNEVHDGTKVPDAMDDDAYHDLNKIIVGWEVFRAAFRRRIEVSAQLPAPLPESTTPTTDGQMFMSMHDLQQRWLKEKERSVAVKGDMDRMVRLFVGVNGNVPIHSVTAAHRLAFRDAVRVIPEIKAQTQNKLMGTFSALGSFAEKIGVVTSNPIRTFAFEVTDELDVEPFTDEQLNKVFRSAAWKKRSPKYREFLRWAFVIGAYTGARLGEIAQLRAKDVYPHAGERCIEFTNDPETGQRTKGRKTRLVPVAEFLVEYGFLKLVENRKQGQLFPEVRPDKKGNWSGLVSGKASEVIRGAGLPEEIRFHSLRHTIKTRLRSKKVVDSVNDWITHPGGKKQSVPAKYGEVEIEAMKEAIDLLNYKVSWPRS